jgi:hypothetical protein
LIKRPIDIFLFSEASGFLDGHKSYYAITMLSRCEREKKLIKQENIKKNKLIKKTETREKIKKPIRKPEKKN